MLDIQTDYKPVVIVDTTNLSKETWLEYRRTGIGGSDVAAILGVSPYTTSRDLYYDKLGIVSAIDDEDNWVQKEIGHLLEELVAKIFHKKTGYRIFQIKKMFRHPLYPFMIADVDYFVELPDGSIAILEIKTTNYNNTDQWWNGKKETVPLHYDFQGRQYMSVTNLNRVYYCCLYGNTENEVIIRHIDRDLVYESEMIAHEEYFWNNHVQANIPPPYTEAGKLILESVKRHVGNADTKAPEILLTGDYETNIIRFLELQGIKQELDEKVKVINSQLTGIKGLIADAMGKSCLASCNVGGISYEVTYNPSYTTDIDKNNLFKLKERHPEIYKEYVTVSESRRFYIKRKKSDNKAA
jgi:putative phage-type endonuclease